MPKPKPSSNPAQNGLFETSQTVHGLQVSPHWHYFAFFRLLQVSPSYLMAHQQASGQELDLVPDGFAKVEETYERFGSVWDRPFWKWWLDQAQFEFGVRGQPRVEMIGSTNDLAALSSQDTEALSNALSSYFHQEHMAAGLPPTLILVVPTNEHRHAILTQVGQFIDQHQAHVHAHAVEPAAPFKIIRNKTRRVTINAAIRCVRAKAYHPNDALYEIGIKARISALLASQIAEQEADTGAGGASIGAKREMTFLISRHIRRCWLWSENAARGSFPDAERPARDDGWPSFDYGRLQPLLASYVRVSEEAFAKMPAKIRTSEKRYTGVNRTLNF